MKYKYKNHIIEVEDCDNMSSTEIKKRVISIAKRLDDAKFKYEVLWYEGSDEDDGLHHDPKTKEFNTRLDALKFYNEHKDDNDKFDWWVTKRDENWDVIEDIIY